MTKILKFFSLIVLLTGVQTVMAANNQIENIRFSAETTKARVVITLNNKTPKYRYFFLQQPERMVLDIFDTQLSSTFGNKPFTQKVTNGFITDIRSGKDKTNTRLVLDLKQPATASLFIIKANRVSNTRLVIDLNPTKAPQLTKSSPQNVSTPQPATASQKLTLQPITATPAKTQANQAPKTQTRANSITEKTLPKVAPAKSIQTSGLKPKIVVPLKQNTRKIVVVIDAGHGGKDPGAIGSRGTQEKNVVLAIANELKTLINQQPGMMAIMTRREDYYIALRQRLNLARKDKADMFIAIHADAVRNRRSYGSSVYALSERGASSEAVRWLAEKENYSELGGVNLDDKSDLLRSVLLDLSQTATINQSLRLGNSVLQSLSDINRLHYTRVEQARFVVLKSPDIPSILVETGFISNPKEESQLSNDAYQHRLAQALLMGIRRYFTKFPPNGTVASEDQQ